MMDPESKTTQQLRTLNEGVEVPDSLAAAMDGVTIPLASLEGGCADSSGVNDFGLTNGEIQSMFQ